MYKSNNFNSKNLVKRNNLFMDFNMDKILKEINKDFINCREENKLIAWIWPMKFGIDIRSNILGAIDILHYGFEMNKTWEELTMESMEYGHKDLAVYIDIIKNFMKRYSSEIKLVYYTEMISKIDKRENYTGQVVQFNPSIMVIDIAKIRKRLEEENKSLWRLIKDNRLLIRTKYEDSNRKKINFWDKKVDSRYPEVYYRFVEIDEIEHKVHIESNILVDMN